MLFSVLAHTGQLPTTNSYPAPNVDVVLRLSDPGLEPQGTGVKERIQWP